MRGFWCTSLSGRFACSSVCWNCQNNLRFDGLSNLGRLTKEFRALPCPTMSIVGEQNRGLSYLRRRRRGRSSGWWKSNSVFISPHTRILQRC
ncbi:hypothetical protein IFM47457_07265 [Aspergillus lentulus]|nr:hypothetical protein IFM47457_07265 [Aspergillus lentulus]